jgi:hypothetical protein
MRLILLALLLPQSTQAHSRPQFQNFGTLVTGHVKSLVQRAFCRALSEARGSSHSAPQPSGRGRSLQERLPLAIQLCLPYPQPMGLCYRQGLGQRLQPALTWPPLQSSRCLTMSLGGALLGKGQASGEQQWMPDRHVAALEYGQRLKSSDCMGHADWHLRRGGARLHPEDRGPLSHPWDRSG